MVELETDKKAALVEVAFEILQNGGLQALSFSTIAKTAGLSRQLVRYYFDDMEALMVALCDHLASAYRAAMIAGVVEREDSQRLEFFLDFYFDLVENPRKPRDDSAFDACLSFAAGSPAVRENLRSQYGLLGQVVSHEVQLQHPQMRSEHAMELSYLFVCLMYGHWKMVASLGYSEEHKVISRKAMSRLIASYVAHPDAPSGQSQAWSKN